ncbi:uncharacterized protein LOC108052874 [Drosophila rhopaloa]|uniref:Uncharacterized protein LOC108052874 n=1 Tax=Drosophila rhopaloa TaxID=1041015 RepID=A0A6P4FTC0_DRORH|nr:uncharacterized protein LOC108052874 [Drosophila rhopaloa]
MMQCARTDKSSPQKVERKQMGNCNWFDLRRDEDMGRDAESETYSQAFETQTHRTKIYGYGFGTWHQRNIEQIRKTRTRRAQWSQNHYKQYKFDMKLPRAIIISWD